MRNLTEFEAVIHDWDDTIHPTFEPILQTHQEFASLHGLALPTRDQLKGVWGRPLEYVLATLYPGAENVLPRIREFTKDRRFELFPGVSKTLRNLRNMGHILGVVSSGPKYSIERALSANPEIQGLHYFIHSAEDCLYHKPDPRAFDLAFTCLSPRGISEESVLYVGDSLSDYRGSRDRGLYFLALSTGFTTREEFLDEGLPEDQILNSFSDLIR